MKRALSLALLAIVLVASLGFAPAAYADDASTDASANGVGKLTAQGDGIAILFGKGTVELSGNGTLWVKDIAGNARIVRLAYSRWRQLCRQLCRQLAGNFGAKSIRQVI